MATRVFLLSADEKAVHVITQILDEQDIRFEHSSDPTFTLKRLAGQHFDVLIVDCDNAESATQVFNSARASSLNRGAIAVAIVEGKAGVPNAFRLGASLVLTKPVSLDQARNTLRTAVGMTRKEPLEMRPPAASVPVVPVIPPPVATVPTPVPAAPVPAAPSPIIALPAPAPAVPSVPPVPVVSASATPPVSAPPVSIPKAVDPPGAPRISAPPIPVAPRAESPSPERVHSTPAIVKDQPVLQVTETRIVKAEEIAEPAPVQEKPKAFSSEKISESLSSALVEPVPNVPAFAKLEAEMADQKPAPETASPLQMFAPLPKEIVDSAADKVDADFEESAAALRAGAVPAFGGLAKQPFAGIDTSHKRGHGALITGVLVAVAAGAFAAAWFYVPGFQKTVLWEVARVREKIPGSSPKPAPAVSVIPSTPAPPVAVSAPIPSDAPAGATATQPSAIPNSVPATPQGSIAQSPASGAASLSAASAASTTSSAPAKSSPAPAVTSSAASSQSSNTASLVNTSATTTSIPAASKPAELFEVPEDYADDQVLHRIHPAYPKVARAKKIQGTVVLQAIVDKQGKVDSLQLVSGDPLLAQAAADAVKQWRYKPYSHNGDPAEFQTRITVDFRLP